MGVEGRPSKLVSPGRILGVNVPRLSSPTESASLAGDTSLRQDVELQSVLLIAEPSLQHKTGYVFLSHTGRRW